MGAILVVIVEDRVVEGVGVVRDERADKIVLEA